VRLLSSSVGPSVCLGRECIVAKWVGRSCRVFGTHLTHGNSDHVLAGVQIHSRAGLPAAKMWAEVHSMTLKGQISLSSCYCALHFSIVPWATTKKWRGTVKNFFPARKLCSSTFELLPAPLLGSNTTSANLIDD